MIQKKKNFLIYCILFLLLITLSIGLCFVFGSFDLSQESEAWLHKYTYKIKPYWINAYSTKNISASSSTYKSADGNEYTGSLGTIEVELSATSTSSGWSKGGGGSSTDLSTLSVWGKNSLTVMDVFGAHFISKFNISVSVTPANGFLASSILTYSDSDHSGSEPTFSSSKTFSDSENITFYNEKQTTSVSSQVDIWAYLGYDKYTYNYDYVVYKPKEISITYNDGLNSVKIPTLFYDNYNLPASIPTKDGYTFMGWYTSSSGGSRITSSTLMNKTDDHTIYARWEENKYNLRTDTTGTSFSDVPYIVSVTTPGNNCYPFKINSNGYYESTNRGVSNSFSICKVTFSIAYPSDISFSVINFGESSYDFGIFSNLDKTLTFSNTADTTNVYKCFKGSSLASTQTVTYNNVIGEHFIYIKYRKDGSNNFYNDSLQFNLVSTITSSLGVTNFSSSENFPFILNSSGYYESNNKGVHNTFSLAKVNIYVPKTMDLNFSVINYAESSYDFGIFSNLDVELSTDKNEDFYNVKRSFKGSSSSSPQTLTYPNVSAGNHYIYVKFRKDFSGHSYNDSLQFKLDEGEKVLYTYDSSFYKGNPSKIGYSFNGWTATNLDTSTAKTGTSSSSVNSSWTSGSTLVTNTYFKNLNSNMGTVTLTANFGADGFPLKADINKPDTETFLNKVSWSLPSGWSSSSDKSYASKTVKYDSVYGELPSPKREGYTFAGWYDAKSGGNQVSSGTYMRNGVCGWASDKREATIYAHWRANTYTVNFNGNGNTGGSMTSQSFTYDVEQKLKANGFTKTGYTFAGWSTSASGGVVYKDNQPVSNLTSTSGGVVTLYAKWTANSYNIVFNANGGSGSMSNQSMTYDKASNLTPNTFTRQGYYFTGWSTSSSGAVVYKDGASVNNLVTSDSITLYAVWLDTWANHATAPEDPEGKGYSNDPYIIDSAEDLAWMINNHGGEIKYFKQTKAINLSKYNWYPIGTETTPFKGVYNGQGYEITNLQIPEITNASGQNIQSNVGLFGYCSGADITGVYLKNASVNGKENVGLIAGYSLSTKIHSNIIENGRIKAVGKYGAIAGNVTGGEIKFNLAYITTNGGTSTNGLYNGSATILTNLIENNGTRAKVGTDNLSGWGKVSNRLMPTEISWGAKVLPATSADFTNWINKTLN